METVHDFDPISVISGNLELTLNLTEYDEYEPPMNNLVLAVGKTGRANRITFKSISSEEIQEIIDSLEEAKNQVEELEELGNIDVDEKVETELSQSEQTILQYIKEQKGGVSEDEINQHFEDKFEEHDTVVSNSLEALKAIGEIYNGGNGYKALE